jgi:hypothetical protein
MRGKHVHVFNSHCTRFPEEPFFTVEEIEFDIDPREVKGQQELNALFGFMRCLAQATDKEVVLTAENMREIVIFRASPGNAAIEYHAFGGWHDWRK